MIAELVRQYDTLKRCNVEVPDPYFNKLKVWIEVVIKSDGSFRVNWLGKSEDTKTNQKRTKEKPYIDLDCPVTEKSGSRSSGNESPHGLVDNARWIFGKFATEQQKKKSQLAHEEQNDSKRKKIPPDEVRRKAYLSQMKAFYDSEPEKLVEVETIYKCLCCEDTRSNLWIAVENELKDKIVDGKGVRLFEKDQSKWQSAAAKANIRWVIERLGESGKPVNALENVKKAWKAFQEDKNEWSITSLVDGQRTRARILHPKIRGASLVSFNNAATYCAHLSPEYRGKRGKDEEETDGGALSAQVGFEEAEKYSKALDWLIEYSSIKFDDSVNCIWIDQGQSEDKWSSPGIVDSRKSC
jgi:hypothetical protein